jgi:MarR family transcriptional regulator, organic hydroperoxide resistance regulator
MAKQTSEEISSLFFSKGRILRQKLQIICPLANLSPTQLEVMRFIDEKKQAAMKKVAEFLAITPPSATVLVEHLAKMNLISRNENKNDRRAVFLTLTPKGKKMLRLIIKNRHKRFKQLLLNLNHEEQLSLLNILRKMFKQ